MAESSDTSKILSPKEYKDISYEYAEEFVNECAAEFGWRRLSKNLIMDVGCGRNLNCCKVILKEFPRVKTLFAFDKDPSVFRTEEQVDKRIRCCVGNILERDSLKKFKRRLDKVISTDTIHTIYDKKLVFENVYRMLRRGGQVAFHFILDSCYYNFLTVLLEIPKFRKMYKAGFTPNMYPKEHRSVYYKQMLEEVGFRKVRSNMIEKTQPPLPNEEWRDLLYDGYKNKFEIPPEEVDEIKEEAFQIYVTRIEKDEEKYSYRVLMLSLLGVKPKSRRKSKRTVR